MKMLGIDNFIKGCTYYHDVNEVCGMLSIADTWRKRRCSRLRYGASDGVPDI